MDKSTAGVRKKKESKLTSGTTKLMAIAPRGRRSETWGLLEEVLVGVLGAIEQRRHQESRVGPVEWCDGEGVPEKEVFIGQNGKGKFDLSLRRIREIREYLSGYGNYSHDNQGIAQVIWQEAVMILEIFHCARSPGRSIGSSS